MSLDKVTMANSDVLGQGFVWLESGRGAALAGPRTPSPFRVQATGE